MLKPLLAALLLLISCTSAWSSEQIFEKDSFKTSSGTLDITFIGHATVMFQFQGKTIYADPVSRLADFAKLPKADLILLTHEHKDHLDQVALQNATTSRTVILLTEKCAEKVVGGMVMHNGDVKTVLGLKIEAVPAYNLVNRRENGQPFHPRGAGNGYILTFGDKRVYLAGDTENIPEMKHLKKIDIAFLPMNLPFTMTPEMAADAARSFKPRLLYPYHYGDTDPFLLVDLLKGNHDMEVRVRRMK